MRLSSPAKRFAGHMLEIGLLIVTLFAGWVVWSVIAYGRGQTPAKQLLNMRVVKLETADKTWLVVLAPPSRMENRGLPREMLKAGTKASVVGYPNRSDPGEMRAEAAMLCSGTRRIPR